MTVDQSPPLLRTIVAEAHRISAQKGFWDEHGNRDIYEALCLIHTEVSEAVEALQGGNSNLFLEELADIVIRVFDLAGGIYGLDGGPELFEGAIMSKMMTNAKRSYSNRKNRYDRIAERQMPRTPQTKISR